MILGIILGLVIYTILINIKFFNRSIPSSLLVGENKLQCKFPSGPLILPIIGSLYKLSLKYPHLSFKQLSNKYGKVFSLKMGSIDTIVINDINFLQKSFRDNPTFFSQRFHLPSFYYMGKHQDIFFGNGSHWKKLKDILSSSITKSKSRQMEELFNDEYFKAEEYLLKKINQDNNIDMGPIFKRILLNILYRFLFGVSFEYGDNLLSKEFYSFIQSYNKLFEYLSKQPADFIPILKPFNTYKEIEKEYNNCLNFFQPLIDNILKNINDHDDHDDDEDDGKEPKCFLEYFISEIQKDTSNLIKITDLPCVCFDILVAGIVTTSTTMDWMLLYLTNYPNIQEKLFCEINIPNHPLHKDKLQFPYLNSIIKETLRISPPAPFALPHICTDDIVIDDIFIPKNTQIIPNLYGCNRSNIDNSESNIFNPDRFLSKDELNIGQCAFSSGLRQCPGANFADSIMFLVSTKLYKTFKFERTTTQLNDENGHLSRSLCPLEFKSKLIIRK
ncbi:hypothetical protein ACTFIY_009351 [Dictyostelium cf. discoideum]